MSRDELRELLDDLRQNWRDSYWWLDHPELRTAILAFIAGAIGLLFFWLQLLLASRYRIQPQE